MPLLNQLVNKFFLLHEATVLATVDAPVDLVG